MAVCRAIICCFCCGETLLVVIFLFLWNLLTTDSLFNGKTINKHTEILLHALFIQAELFSGGWHWVHGTAMWCARRYMAPYNASNAMRRSVGGSESTWICMFVDSPC